MKMIAIVLTCMILVSCSNETVSTFLSNKKKIRVNKLEIADRAAEIMTLRENLKEVKCDVFYDLSKVLKSERDYLIKRIELLEKELGLRYIEHEVVKGYEQIDEV